MQTLPEEKFSPNIEGLYALPDSVYHNYQKSPAVSRSLLVEVISTSPAHAKAMRDESATFVTPAMTSGTLMDKALLEPDKFKEGVSHWVKPAGMKLSTKEGIQWKKDHPGVDDGGLPYLPAESDAPDTASVADIKGMIESVMDHPIGRRAVETSVKQESAFCYDVTTGLLRKCRPDMRLYDNSGRMVLVDLKTTSHGGGASSVWSGHCARMSYHVQDAFYTDIYQDLLGSDPMFIFMVVERKKPYAVRLFQIEATGKQVGREKYQRAMSILKTCEDSGHWPSYSSAIEVIRLPRWETQAVDPIVQG